MPMKIKLYILLFLLSNVLFSQKVTTSIDSTKKKIGSEFLLTLKTTVNKTDNVVFPKANAIGSLEVINNYKTDTLEKDEKIQLTKKYGITQFDAGSYTIPRIPIQINKKKLFSDSIKIEVVNVKVDTTKQKMYDIKSIAKTPSSSKWWIYIAILLLLIILGYFGYKFFKKSTKREPVVEADTRSPYERANAFLQQLDQKNWIEKGELKTYYSELTDIARQYIEEEINIPAKESTTTQLIDLLRAVALQKKYAIQEDAFTNFEKILQKADLVKFAKLKPDSTDAFQDKKNIENTVHTLHNAIPVDDNGFNEEEQQKINLQNLEKAKKHKQIKIAVAALLSILLLAGIILFTYGYSYLKDNLLGHHTKDLVDGDWVHSEYGNPAIKIETPKVLKRVALPQNAKTKKQKNIPQTFAYGSIFDNFYVVLNTQKFDTAVDIDNPNISLEPIAEAIIREYEKQGAKNIIVKSEDFDTQKGLKGKKVFGSMSVPDTFSKDMVKLNYEVLIFAQYGGLQSIMIAHREDDAFGKQIVERIEKSIELMPSL